MLLILFLSLFMSFVSFLMRCFSFLNLGFVFFLGFLGIRLGLLVLVCAAKLLMTFRSFMISLSQGLVGSCVSSCSFSFHSSAISLPSFYLCRVMLCLCFM